MDTQAEVEEAFENSSLWGRGYQTGYEIGQEEGWKQGYKKGYQDAYLLAFWEFSRKRERR